MFNDAARPMRWPCEPFIAGALLLLCGGALAQTHNNPPACWPRDAGGTGTPLVVKAGIGGMAFGWYCPETGAIKTVAGPWSAFVADFDAEARRLMVASDAERVAAWRKYVTRTAPLSPGVAALRDAVVAEVKARHLVPVQSSQ